MDDLVVQVENLSRWCAASATVPGHVVTVPARSTKLIGPIDSRAHYEVRGYVHIKTWRLGRG